MIDRDAFKIGIDVEGAKKDVNEILHLMEEGMDRMSAGGLSARQMDAEIKKMRLYQQQARVANEVLAGSEKEVKFLQQKLQLAEKLERYSGANSPMARAIQATLNFAGEAGLAGQRADWQGWIGSASSRFAGQMLGHVPVVGGFMRDVANIYANEQQRAEERADLRYTLFRDVGPAGRRAFMGADRPGAMQDMMIGMGASIEDRAKAVQALGGAGIDPSKGLLSLVSLQQGYGFGAQGGAALGALRRAGVSENESIDALGESIGAATALGLERGRLGEALSSMTRLANQSTSGLFSKRAAEQLESSVNAMGGAFRGDTAAHAAMEAGLNQLSRGEGGPMAQVVALQAAGLGKGVDYFTASYEIQKDLADRPGAEQALKATIKTYADRMGGEEAWSSGNEEKKKAIVINLGRIGVTGGLTGPQAMAYLDTVYGGGNVARIASALGFGKSTSARLAAGAIDLPSDISTRQHRALGEALDRGAVSALMPPFMIDAVAGINQSLNGVGVGGGGVAGVGSFMPDFARGVGSDLGGRQSRAAGQAASVARSAIFGAGGTAGRFPASTERWRNLIGIVGPAYGFGPEDTDFLLSWLKRESEGDPRSRTKYNERGLFQVMGSHPDVLDERGRLHKAITYAESEAGGAGIPEDLFNISGVDPRGRGTPDPLATVQVGLMLAAYRRKRAQNLAPQFGTTDMHKLTKYLHAMPAGAEHDVAAFTKKFGRAPTSFDELASVVTPNEAHWFMQAQQVGNAGAPLRVDINLNVNSGTATATTSRAGQGIVGRIMTSFRGFGGH